MRLLLLFLCLASEFCIAQLCIAPLCLSQVVPLNLEGPVPIAKVRLNGKGPFRMLIDTGATSCTLLPRIARALHVAADYRVVDVTPTGQQSVAATRSIEVAFGERLENNVEFLLRETPGLAEAGVEADGVIGQSLLSRFDYLLDYKTRQLVLNPAAPPAGERLAFQLVARRMLLTAVDPGATIPAMHLILDSAASNLCLWGASNGLVLQPVADLVAVNGRRNVKVVRMPLLIIGNRVLRNLDAIVAPSQDSEREDDGLLPASLFRSVYVSNSESYVKLQR